MTLWKFVFAPHKMCWIQIYIKFRWFINIGKPNKGNAVHFISWFFHLWIDAMQCIAHRTIEWMWMWRNSLNANHCCSNKLTFFGLLLLSNQFQNPFVFPKFSIDLTSQPMILFCDLNFVPIFMSSTNNTHTYISINNARNQKLSHFSLLKWNEQNERRKK